MAFSQVRLRWDLALRGLPGCGNLQPQKRQLAQCSKEQEQEQEHTRQTPQQECVREE